MGYNLISTGMRKLTNDKICDTFFSDEDINREVLLQLITDLSGFKEALSKARDRLAVKRVVKNFQKPEKVL